VAAIVLAAGKGTRMRSARHKVLHRLAGKSMLWHVLRALHDAGVAAERTTIVIGDGAAGVRAEVETQFPGASYLFALQDQQLGTGHAALQARPYVPQDASVVIVAFGDTPLLQSATVSQLIETHGAKRAPVTLVSGRLPGSPDLGRIVRDATGRVTEIVENRDATPDQRAIDEVNSGFCAFTPTWLWSQLPRVTPARNGEIYLTALPALAIRGGDGAESLVLDDVSEAIGVNTREQQSGAEATLRRRITGALLESGVTIQDRSTTYVDAGVVVGSDTTIFANTHLRGATRVGSECEIGPNSVITDSVIGNGCRVMASVLDGAMLEEEVTVGPFAHLRPQTYCGRGTEVGTGSEIKASSLGARSRMHHFGYLGDTTVGEGVNVGAGTITCNFDGERKHPTRIGDGAFIGSGTLLIAPVEVGDHALTGAGSVVVRDVAAWTKVVGVPARVIGARTHSQEQQTQEQRREPNGDDTRPIA